jgi:hypothetical protein
MESPNASRSTLCRLGRVRPGNSRVADVPRVCHTKKPGVLSKLKDRFLKRSITASGAGRQGQLFARRSRAARSATLPAPGPTWLASTTVSPNAMATVQETTISEQTATISATTMPTPNNLGSRAGNESHMLVSDSTSTATQHSHEEENTTGSITTPSAPPLFGTHPTFPNRMPSNLYGRLSVVRSPSQH